MYTYEKSFKMDVTYGNKTTEKAYAGYDTDSLMDIKSMYPWTITLKYKRRQMTFDFWTGELIGEPTLGMVFDNIVLTTLSIDNADSFDSWCHDLGYSTDSRKAYEGYKQACKLAFKFKKLVRNDYEWIVRQYERWNG